jgi:hypothetical protein
MKFSSNESKGLDPFKQFPVNFSSAIVYTEMMKENALIFM